MVFCIILIYGKTWCCMVIVLRAIRKRLNLYTIQIRNRFHLPHVCARTRKFIILPHRPKKTWNEKRLPTQIAQPPICIVSLLISETTVDDFCFLGLTEYPYPTKLTLYKPYQIRCLNRLHFSFWKKMKIGKPSKEGSKIFSSGQAKVIRNWKLNQ